MIHSSRDCLSLFPSLSPTYLNVFSPYLPTSLALHLDNFQPTFLPSTSNRPIFYYVDLYRVMKNPPSPPRAREPQYPPMALIEFVGGDMERSQHAARESETEEKECQAWLIQLTVF